MSTLDTPRQPRPLRVIAAIGALATLAAGGLPTVGVPVSPALAGWLSGIVGALSAVAVAVVGEPLVTPVRSPRDDDGTRLVPAAPIGPPQEQL